MSVILFIAIILVLFVITIFLFTKFAPQFGAQSYGERLERIKRSKNFYSGKFQNLVKTTITAPNTNLLKNGLKFFKRIPGQIPDKPIETMKFDKIAFMERTEGIKISWFGHSTVFVNFEGRGILFDPIFSKRASPFQFLGVKRFEYTNQFSVDDLPEIDMVVISHDHFDHLDYRTIQQLSAKVKHFYVPLGVASHLIKWGTLSDKIIELEWWDEATIDRGIKIISTPARHFSGRVGAKMDYTFWCSWVIEKGERRIFFCGDSGYSDHFKEIGRKLGPFELTMMECGQYNKGWPFIHMNPEESVHAHLDLRGKKYLPIHWGKFKLSVHNWKEPIQRAIKEAERFNVHLINPLPGQIIYI